MKSFRRDILAFLCFLMGAGMAASQPQGDDTPKDSIVMKEVTVDGSRTVVSYRLDRQRISAGGVLTAQGGTAMDVMAALPGVQVDSEGQLTMRGSSAFLVYVDGKPSVMSGVDALQMIPASTIRTIEVLTTPPAKYKVEGDVGIIHIITKNSQVSGLDVALNGTASTWGTLGLDGKVNYRMGSHNIYLSGQGTNLKNRSEFSQEKWTQVGDAQTLSYADGTRFRHFGTYIGSGGYEYNDKQHSFSLDLQGGRTRNPRGGDMSYHETRKLAESLLSDCLYDSHDRYCLTKKLFQTSIDYTWIANERGDELNVNSRFRYDCYSEEYTESNMFDEQGERYEGTRGYETEHHWDCDGGASYKIKYRPQGRVELGYLYTTYSEHGDYKINYWNRQQSQFEWQDDLYAPFYYRRQVHASYAQWNDRFGPLAIDAGLRAESLKDDMSLPTITSRHRSYTDFFPSAHLGYYTQEAGTFAVGYSRRTNRPGIWKLEPYITYEDYYTRIIGNPDLQAEYIHSMEVGWRRTLPSGLALSATAYARRRTGVVDYVRRPYESGVTLDSIINAGNSWEKGLEAQLVLEPIKWWRSTLNGNVYHYNFHATYEGAHHSKGWSGQMGWVNAFTVARDTRLQFDGHYVGPMQLTQGRESAYFYFDMAARQTLLRGKLSIGLVAHDVFHTAKYHSRRYTSFLNSETWVRPRYPNVSLTLTYHFRQPSSKQKEGAISDNAEFVGRDF